MASARPTEGMDVLVVGAGSLGSLVGGLLAPDHEVTLVGRDPHVAAILADGLAIDGEVEARVHPDATTDPAGASADLAMVTVKAPDTADAAATIADCDVDAVWSLQNGLGNEATLAAALDVPVLAGTATYGADRSAPGSVTCTGLGEVAIGPRPDTPTPEADAALAERLAGALAPANGGSGAAAEAPRALSIAFDPAMPTHLWRKLAVNVGINPTTALARVRNGALAEGEARETARTAARETARVAQARGVDLAENEAASALDSVVAATAENRSSMLQDVERGRRTEIDAIAGAVVDRADDEGVDVPVTRTLASLVRAWERENGLR
jgi:2-dehydropantoate 2-reductase